MENNCYDRIAWDYHLKRKKPWKALEEFLDHLKEKKYNFKGYCIDLGCGSGRNFTIINNLNNKLIGIDNSIEFLNIAKSNLNDINHYSKIDVDNIQLILGDLEYIPIKAKVINNIFSIAAVHHIKSKERRQEVFTKISEKLTHNGFIILTLWRKWQSKFRKYFFFDWFKRKFSRKYKNRQKKIGLSEFGDKYIPWTLSKEKKTYNRFYHFFSKRELKNLLKSYEIKEFKIMGGPSNKDNFFVVASL